MKINLVFYGDKFYEESGTMFGVLYIGNENRSDWAQVMSYLNKGDEVYIRPATKKELSAMQKKLDSYIKNMK